MQLAIFSELTLIYVGGMKEVHPSCLRLMVSDLVAAVIAAQGVATRLGAGRGELNVRRSGSVLVAQE